MKPSEPNRKASNKSHAAKKANGARTEDRFERISIAAYYRAEARGFEPGLAMEDWLTAEAEVDRMAAG